jgi:hypothetical protein
MNAQERIAIALFHDWQTSDSELNMSWEEATPTIQRVFLRNAEVALEALSLPLEHMVSFLHTADALGIATEDKPLSEHLENYLEDRGLTR